MCRFAVLGFVLNTCLKKVVFSMMKFKRALALVVMMCTFAMVLTSFAGCGDDAASNEPHEVAYTVYVSPDGNDETAD